MTVNVEPTTYTLQIRRELPASPQRVFDAWTDPVILASWFAPDASFTTSVHEIDLRVGGRYRIEMRSPDGAPHTPVGEYREVRPGVRLAFTWKWAEQPEMQDTLVTLDFVSRGSGTELVLTHSLFTSEEGRDRHGKGWDGCLALLVVLLDQKH